MGKVCGKCLSLERSAINEFNLVEAAQTDKIEKTWLITADNLRLGA